MSALWLITCVVAFHPIDFLTVLHPVSLAISLCDVIHRYRALICRCCPCVECVSCLHFSGCPLLSPAYVLVHMLCLCRVCGVKQQRSQSKKHPPVQVGQLRVRTGWGGASSCGMKRCVFGVAASEETTTAALTSRANGSL